MRSLCRTCGDIPLNSDVKNLFNDNELVAFIQIISGMQIKNKVKLPVNICNVCHNMLNEMISFQKRCILVQNFFNFKIWKEHKSKEASKSTVNLDLPTNEENEEIEKYNLHEDLSENVKDYSPTQDLIDDIIYDGTQDSDEEVIYEGESDNQIAATENSYLDELELHDDDVESDMECNRIRDEKITKRHDVSNYLNRLERKWICEICGKMLKSSSILKRHRYTHDTVKAFKCSGCYKSFNFLFELKKHELTHTENHPFVCSFCSAKFSYSSAKKRHEKIHTNERPHKCSYCEKSFIEKSKLRKHETTHFRTNKF